MADEMRDILISVPIHKTIEYFRSGAITAVNVIDFD